MEKQLVEHLCDEIIRNQNILVDYSLISGKAGISIALYEAGNVLNNKEYCKVGINLINEAIHNIEKLPDLSFANGVSGVIWSYLYMFKNCSVLDEIDVIDLDQYLLAKCQECDNYDLFRGLIGYGIYFLSRFHFNGNDKYLKQVVDRLLTMSINTKHGELWIYTHPVDGTQVYNLGLAHGIPSIIAFLCEVYPLINDYEYKKKIYLAVNSSVTAICSIKNKNDKLSLYPNHLELNLDYPSYEYSRLAWCYGDMGIANTIFKAGVLFNVNKWEYEAKHIVINSCRRDYTNSGIVDVPFCHGISGIAFLYNNILQYIDEPCVKDRALYWKNLIYKNKIIATDNKFDFYVNDTYVRNYGVLEGYAGIILVLLSLSFKKKSNWKSIFLL